MSFLLRIFGLVGLCCGCLVACNATHDTSQKPAPEPRAAAAAPAAAVQVDYESFAAMNAEERWNALSPERRNYLRLNPDLYPYFKPLIAAYPNMEEVAAANMPSNNTSPPPNAFMDEGKHKTPAEWWASFSESRRQYMIQNPQYYPQFKEFIDKAKKP